MKRAATMTPGRMAAIGGAGATGLAVWWLSGHDRRRWAGRRMRYFAGRLTGVRYRLAGGHPAENVSDDVLTDRVRSVLGQTTRTLDVPHVHVTVSRRVVLLHGEVGSFDDAAAIEKAAHVIDGVDGVLSYLHVGLQAGATRPSEGAFVHTPSAALQKLLQAAESAGVPQPVAAAAVRAVLATFLGRLPVDARDHVLGHLPRDVQVLTTPPRRRGAVAKLRRFDDFIHAVLETNDVDPRDPALATKVIDAVLGALRELVPEEAAHVAAVLPSELRRLWPVPAPMSA